MSKPNGGNILDGVEKAINRLFKKHRAITRPFYTSKPQYKHLSFFQSLDLANALGHFGQNLVTKIHGRIILNYGNEVRKVRSKQNWRFRLPSNKRIPAQDWKPGKVYTEVSLERRIIEVAEKEWPGSWRNQVPTASGLTEGVRDTHRNIDLVRKRGERSFELIELKVTPKSGHPLYAALEILQYGILYILYRIKNLKQQEPSNSIPKILDATEIHLKVLAPRNYYVQSKATKERLLSIEAVINEGLSGFLVEHSHQLDHLEMNFRFESFPLNFMQNQGTIPGTSEIRAALLEREPACRLLS